MAREVDRRLSEAARLGNVAGIERLIAAGAHPNVFEGMDEWTPLLWAASFGHVAAIAALMKAAARVDVASSYGTTPLMGAAQSGQAAAVAALLAAGADVHRVNNGGDTALHLASRWGHFGAARVLLRAGVWADVRNKSGERPIDAVRTLVWWLRDRPQLLPRRCAQVWAKDEAGKAALRSLFASAAPWSRRRPVALACYAVGWEWEA
jgi:ankyrin repeat protein